MTFKELNGKTITRATKKKLKGFDDEGYIKLFFSDGTSVIIVASYGGYTGKSEDEYPTDIYIEEEGAIELVNA